MGTGPGHGAVGRQGPALTGGGGGDVEQRLVGQTQLLAEHEGFADRDHGDAQDQVVADLGGLASAVLPAVDHTLAHHLQQRPDRLEILRQGAHHERQGSGLGTHHAAGDGRIH